MIRGLDKMTSSVKSFLIKLSLVSLLALLVSFANPQKAGAQGSGFWNGTTEEIQHYLETYNSSYSIIEQKQELEEEFVAGEHGYANSGHVSVNSARNLEQYSLTSIWGYEAANLTASEIKERDALLGRGAIPILGESIAFMYQKPASTQTYLADLFQSAKIIPTAQAQGLGFASLDPILEVWKVFRNLAYMVFVIIFLIIGFLIMFRHKVGGQTAITVQQAIPNIIVALIFVTFSYAIGGLLIDFMYLLMYLIIGLFDGSRNLINQNFLSLGLELVKGGFSQSRNAASSIIQEIIQVGGVDDILGWIGGLTVAVIVSLAILYGVFRLFFEVLKSYVSIILLIAFSPLLLMVGALPGQNPFGNWIKNLVGNLSIFPIILVLLIIRNIFAQFSFDGSGGFMPPYLISQGLGAALPSIVGIGILLTIPEIAKKTKEALGAKEGVFGELVQAAGARAKTAVPAGTRAVGLGAGMAGGLAAGAGGFGYGLLAGDPLHHGWEGAKEAGGLILGGRPNATFNIPFLGKRQVNVPGTIRAAGGLSRSIGANQPDIMNLITNPMDRRWDPEGAKRQQAMQLWEDISQAHEETGISGRDRASAEKKKRG